MDKLEKLMQRYDSNAMPRSAWLDALTFSRIEELHHAMGPGTTRPVIIVELERWDRCVMYAFKAHSCLHSAFISAPRHLLSIAP